MRTVLRSERAVAVGILVVQADLAAGQVPPRLDIDNFDVNTGDATLILSPDGRGVLIDAGNRGCGNNPINEFMTRARGSAAAFISFLAAALICCSVGSASDSQRGR